MTGANNNTHTTTEVNNTFPHTSASSFQHESHSSSNNTSTTHKSKSSIPPNTTTSLIIYSHLTHKKYNVALKPRHIKTLTTRKLKSNLQRVSGVKAEEMVLWYDGRIIHDEERVGEWHRAVEGGSAHPNTTNSLLESSGDSPADNGGVVIMVRKDQIEDLMRATEEADQEENGGASTADDSAYDAQQQSHHYQQQHQQDLSFNDVSALESSQSGSVSNGRNGDKMTNHRQEMHESQQSFSQRRRSSEQQEASRQHKSLDQEQQQQQFSSPPDIIASSSETHQKHDNHAQRHSHDSSSSNYPSNSHSTPTSQQQHQRQHHEHDPTTQMVNSHRSSSKRLLSRRTDLAETAPMGPAVFDISAKHSENNNGENLSRSHNSLQRARATDQPAAPDHRRQFTPLNVPPQSTEASPQKRSSQPQPESHPLNNRDSRRSSTQQNDGSPDDEEDQVAETPTSLGETNSTFNQSTSSRLSIRSARTTNSKSKNAPPHTARESQVRNGSPNGHHLARTADFSEKFSSRPSSSKNATFTSGSRPNSSSMRRGEQVSLSSSNLSSSEKQQIIQQFEQRFHQQLTSEKNNLLRLFTDAKKQILKQANSDREKLMRENSRLREELERAYNQQASGSSTVRPLASNKSATPDANQNEDGQLLAQRLQELEHEKVDYQQLKMHFEQRSSSQSDRIRSLENRLAELQTENDKLQERLSFEQQVSQQHHRLKQESQHNQQQSKQWQQEKKQIVRQYEQKIEQLSQSRERDQEEYESEKQHLLHEMEQQKHSYQQENEHRIQQLKEEIGEYIHQVEELTMENSHQKRLLEKAHAAVENNALFVQSAEETIAQLQQHIERLSHGDVNTAQLLVKATRESEMVKKRAHQFEQDNLLVRERLLQETRKRKQLHNSLEDLKGNIRVIVRLRPLLSNEHYPSNMSGRVEVKDDTTVTVTSASTGVKVYDFYQALGFNSVQNDVFEEVKPVIQSAIDGVNVCFIAYGATGSGKTFTIHGKEIIDSSNQQQATSPNRDTGDEHVNQKLSPLRGVLPRAAEELFRHLHQNNIWHSPLQKDDHSGSTDTYSITCSMIELYLDDIKDLLLPPHAKRKKLELREHPTGGMFVQGVSEHPVSNAEELLSLIHQGNEQKQIHKTSVHDRSSRSHTIFTINLVLHYSTGRTSIVSKSRLLFVDLAGSERISRSRATGARFKEAQHINKSLSALGDVICALSKKKSHIPYRNSKLTSILQPCLGGNSKTVMFANISPSSDSHSETSSTLGFASRVKKVQNTSTKNREIRHK